jgi:tRNA A-37 threonylcarbamoyl transferase component Bud32/tetratricopeptide (TPR) repeat protein
MAAQEDPTIAETPRSASRRLKTEPPERYQLLEIIGEGGMGRVYRAHDTTLGRDVAVKMIEKALPGPDKTTQRERFVREARAAARLLHPNIAVIHDVDPDAGFLVMELVEGESLRDAAGKGALSPALVHSIAEQVLAALDAAHAAGIIHRDIKPSNIMIANGHVKLVDFGVARLVDADMTRTGEQVGTPAYMAPEQVRGAQVDARTDLYSLGATLYELITGERMIAFESPGAQAIAKVTSACGNDAALARLIARCLQADPAARHASARDALAALRPADHKQLRVWPFAVAAVALAAIGAGAYLYSHRTPPRDPRLTKAFTYAQRGENEKAAGLLASYLGEHPRDPEALTLKFVTDWWEGGMISAIKDRAQDAPLTAAQRAMLNGIDLITQRREPEAVAFLEQADREHPNQIEILYALGEAQWHGQKLEAGATTLERAFVMDPRWEMALHHVVEFRLSRGETARLVPIANKLRPIDPANAATLDCQIAVGERRYADAVTGAKKALGSLEQIPELYICLAQAQILAGDLDGGEQTAKKAFDLWPIDMREWGGFAQYAEIFLYRGKLAEYLDLLRGKPSRQRALALMIWNHSTETDETTPVGVGMRMPPLGAATWLLQEKLKGHDASKVYESYPEQEVRAWGEALWAPDDDAAIAHLRHALEVPQKGDMRMLVAHELAARLHARGDDTGAAVACDEVIHPRVYENYRAVVLPDCKQWSVRSSR